MIIHKGIFMITCKACEKQKPEDDFYKHPLAAKGRDSTCKECRKAKVRANRKAKIDYYREYDRKRANRPDRVKARAEYAKTPEGIAAGNKAKYKWSERNAKKKWVSNVVNNAVRDGVLIKPDSCSSCGKSNCRIEGHHNDYDRPLCVTWLCSNCHREWHKENGEGLNG